MMKKYIYNKLRCILPTVLLLLAVVSCSVTDGDEPCDTANEVTVHLGISITSARSVEGTQPGTGTPDDLMIWVFGKKAGADAVYDNDPFDYKKLEGNGELKFSGIDLEGRPVQTIPWTIDIQDYVSLKFVVLMNTASVTWSPTLSFNGSTTYSAIMGASFSGVNADVAKEDNQVLMIGEATQDLSSKRSYDITLEATRVVGKMELFFTKAVENASLEITGLQLSGIPEKGYVVTDENTQWDTMSYNGEDKSFLKEATQINTILNIDVIGNFNQYEKENFTPMLLSQPFLLENPNGLSWIDNIQDDIYPGTKDDAPQNAYTLTVSYRWGNEAEQSKTFSLPIIERNTLYKIYVRVLKEQEYQLYYTVCPWGEETAGDITFN